MASSGQRDRLVTIQTLSASKGASNYPVDTWSDLVTVWAYKEDVDASERFVDNQLSAPYDTTWAIPWMEAMDPETVSVPKTKRLVVKGRVHDIVGAKELERRVGIELKTVAGGLLT